MKLPQNVKDQFDKLWKKTEWELLEPKKEGDLRVFKKGCELFHFFVARHENYPETYVFAIEDASGVQIFAADLEVAEQGEAGDLVAMKKADELIQEFINTAILAWMGFELTPTRPPNEIRLKQITIGQTPGDHRFPLVLGLDDDGRAYQRSSGKWMLMSMEVAEQSEVKTSSS